jgi:hypothetical protein
MASRKTLRNLTSLFAASALLTCSLLMSRSAAAQKADPAPVATPPYKIAVFARSANAYSQPDSIVQWKDSILVGFGNGVAKDGTDGGFSTIVQYSLRGKVRRTFKVKGHNDGLRLIGDDDLWALQNEDGNPNLAIIELESGKQKTYTFAPTVHGGGYDDIVVKNDEIFMTASNPTLNGASVNVFPALVRVKLAGSMVTVEPVLNGDANGIDIPTGAPVTLNLTDPDSLTIDPRVNIVLDDQADSQLVFIRNPFTDDQKVGRINITTCTGAPPCARRLTATTVDDTAFAPNARAFLLVSDLTGNAIYRIDSPTFGFEPGVAYSASDTAGIVGVLNLDTGVLTPIVTGLGSGRGMLFVPPDADEGAGGQEDQ